MFEIILSVVVIGLLTFLLFAKPKIPRTKGLGVRSTSSPFSIQEIDRATRIFVDVWSRHHPDHKKKLLKALSRITFFWNQKRIVYNNEAVFAIMINERTVHLWIGPLLKNRTRSLVFTGFFDQLAKIALLANKQEPDTSTTSTKMILVQIREEFKKT